MSLLSINEAAIRLGVSADAVIDAAGFTLGELERAALQQGLYPERYREVPALPENLLGLLEGRLR